MGLDAVVLNNNPMLCLFICMCVCGCVCVCVCVCVHAQIYEDSIVIKSVFESARQRIVTDMEQKETVSASHGDNGGGAEDQFVPAAGEGKKKVIFLNYCLVAVLTFLNLSFESLADFEAPCCCIRLILRSLALLLLPVKPLPVQLKKENQEERHHGQEAPQWFRQRRGSRGKHYKRWRLNWRALKFFFCFFFLLFSFMCNLSRIPFHRFRHCPRKIKMGNDRSKKGRLLMDQWLFSFSFLGDSSQSDTSRCTSCCSFISASLLQQKKMFYLCLSPCDCFCKYSVKKKETTTTKKKKTPVSMTVFNPYIWLYEMPSYVLEHDMYSISLLMPPPPEQHRPAGDDVDEDGGTRGGGRGRYF